MLQTNPRTNPINTTSTLILCVLFLTACCLSGCGGVKFQRISGSKKYRALPTGSAVKVADSTKQLPQPVEQIGTLTIKLKGGSGEAKEAETKLKKHAARYGCDAIVKLGSERKDKKVVTKTKTIGKDGRPVYGSQTKTLTHHIWTAVCVRTAAAPKQPVKRKRKAKRKSSTSKSKVRSSKKKPTKTAKLKAASPAAKDPVAPAVTGEASDAELKETAAEVGAAFMRLSRALSKNNAKSICDMLASGKADDKVVFNIKTRDPVIKLKVDLSKKQACKSLLSGPLAIYLREFSESEVHQDVATLVPYLFSYHRAPFLQLTRDQEKKYGDKLVASRQGKKPLACFHYSVRQAEDLFKVYLNCKGVREYRVLLRRNKSRDFHLITYTHIR